MNTIALENSVRIMSLPYLNNKVNTSIAQEILDPEQNFDKSFLEPFSRELEQNMADKETDKGRETLIKYYIKQYKQAELLFTFNGSLIRNNKNIINKWNKDHNSQFVFDQIKNDYEICVIIVYYIFDRNFYDIQSNCKEYGLNFIDIAIRSKFNIDILQTVVDTTTGKDLIRDKYLTKTLSVLIDKTPTVNEIDFIKHESVEIKPIIKSDLILPIYNLLRERFSKNDHEELNNVLSNGCIAPEKLLYNGAGNQLADVFRQLYNNQIITGCTKKILEEWIYKNFKYIHLDTTNHFSLRYLNDIISCKETKCKNPIMRVEYDNELGSFSIIP